MKIHHKRPSRKSVGGPRSAASFHRGIESREDTKIVGSTDGMWTMIGLQFLLIIHSSHTMAGQTVHAFSLSLFLVTATKLYRGQRRKYEIISRTQFIGQDFFFILDCHSSLFLRPLLVLRRSHSYVNAHNTRVFLFLEQTQGKYGSKVYRFQAAAV